MVNKKDKQKVVSRLLGKRICRNCHSKLDHLIYVSKVEAWQDYRGGNEYGPMDFGDHTDDKYECPECSEVLFNDDESAREFMKRE